MSYLLDFIKNLIDEFDKLPSIGPKTATRLVFNLLHRKEDIKSFSDSLKEAYDSYARGGVYAWEKSRELERKGQLKKNLNL